MLKIPDAENLKSNMTANVSRKSLFTHLTNMSKKILIIPVIVLKNCWLVFAWLYRWDIKEQNEIMIIKKKSKNYKFFIFHNSIPCLNSTGSCSCEKNKGENTRNDCYQNEAEIGSLDYKTYVVSFRLTSFMTSFTEISLVVSSWDFRRNLVLEVPRNPSIL